MKAEGWEDNIDLFVIDRELFCGSGADSLGIPA